MGVKDLENGVAARFNDGEMAVRAALAVQQESDVWSQDRSNCVISVRVGLDVYNLFNRKASDVDYYYVSRLPGEPLSGVADTHFHPVEPRMARITLTANF